MAILLYLAIAPIVIILLYIYIKDKYEKEPKKLALTGTLYGVIISIPITFTEKFLTSFAPKAGTVYYAFFISFVVASFVEETYKYIITNFLIYKNKNFNEPFDGILYSVFISLGFALIENILYVFNPQFEGVYTAIARAIFSVPAHGLFGVFMGYYLSIAKFKDIYLTRTETLNNNVNLNSTIYLNKKIIKILLAILVPILLHGIYDLLLFTQIPYSNVFFILFYIYIWINVIFKIKYYIKISPFKYKNKKK